jgi:uncharacterized protein YueI
MKIYSRSREKFSRTLQLEITTYKTIVFIFVKKRNENRYFMYSSKEKENFIYISLAHKKKVQGNEPNLEEKAWKSVDEKPKQMNCRMRKIKLIGWVLSSVTGI